MPVNNLLVDRLLVAGAPAIDPLADALADHDHPGRGDCAWAPAKLLRATGERPGTVVEALRTGPMADSTMLILRE